VIYDNNIFTYSRDHIDDFLQQHRPYRFPFETYDDLYTELQLDMRFRKKFIQNRTTTFNFGARIRYYTINQQKGFLRVTGGLRQSLGAWAIKGSYRLIPGYLIRYYKDPEDTSFLYLPCKVNYHTVTGKITLPRITIFIPEVFYQYSIDDYHEVFTVYDAQAHAIGLQTDIDLDQLTRIRAQYAFKLSDLDTTALSSSASEDVPDGSYTQHRIGGDIMINGLIISSVSVSLGYHYTFRSYRSLQSNDQMHFGRQDHLHAISIEAVMKIRTGMLLYGSYTHRTRVATSEICPDINTIKNYGQDRMSAGLKFYF
jgi:hypothetical protein